MKLCDGLTKGQRCFPGRVPDFLHFALAQVGNLLNTLHALVEKRNIGKSSFSASVLVNTFRKVTHTQPPTSSRI